MTKRRVMLATPYYDKADMGWVSGVTATLTGLNSHIFDVRVAKSCYVQQGRNDLIGQAIEEAFDDILFVDLDLKAWGPQHVERILSHDLDIVGGCYTKKVSGEPQWTFHAATTEVSANGVVECNDVPTGFLRIRIPCLAKIRERYPWRSYHHEGQPERFEYFPMGLVGPGTPEWKVNEIRKKWDQWDCGAESASHIMWAIGTFLTHCPLASHRQLLGEDVSFCRLARESGLKVCADTKLRLRHEGPIGYPAQEIAL